MCHCLPNPKKGKTSKKDKKDGEKASPLSQIFDNLKQVDWKVFGTLFTLRFLVETAASIYHQNLGYVFAEEFKSTPNEVGLIISFYGICAIVVNVKMNAIRKHVKNGYKWGTIGMLLAFLMIYFIPYFWSYMVFIVLFSLFKTLLESTWTDSIIEMSDEKNNGAVNGAFQSLVQLAGFIAPLINGYMGQMYGLAASNLLCCAVTVVALATTVKLSVPKAKVQ